jgi:hypothetical protein
MLGIVQTVGVNASEQVMTSFSGFRRREARAVNSGNLKWRDTGPSDVDFVAARGMSGDKLGALLEGLKWANDHKAYGRAVGMLSERVQQRTRRGVYLPLVHSAIYEWLDENCRRCIGRGVVANGRGVYSECPKCSGTAQHQHTDFERASRANLQAGAWAKHEKDYEAILSCLRGAVASHRVGAMRAFGDKEEVFA